MDPNVLLAKPPRGTGAARGDGAQFVKAASSSEKPRSGSM